VTIADNTRDDTMAAIAGRILAHAPPRHPRADPAAPGPHRLGRGGRFAEVPANSCPADPPDRQNDPAVRELVAGSGHMSTLDQPEEVIKALTEWLQA
jgi:pimeloyl-ACP methyl ester carboxylesterase